MKRFNVRSRIGRRISIFVALTMIITTISSLGAGMIGFAFTDTTGHWAESVIDTWSERGVINGYEDGTFMPEGNITRAEAAMMFARILAGDEGIPTDLVTSFVDVQDGEWYYDAVTYLQSYNILEGRGENRFEPDDNITRAEFVTICTRFDAYTAVDTINEFGDVTANHWAYAYINYAVHEKWITGYEDGSFRPDNNITRAEAVRVVNNVLGRSADEEYIDENAADMDIFPDVTTAHWAYYDIIEAAIAHDFIASDSAEEWQKTAKADQSDAADE